MEDALEDDDAPGCSPESRDGMIRGVLTGSSLVSCLSAAVGVSAVAETRSGVHVGFVRAYVPGVLGGQTIVGRRLAPPYGRESQLSLSLVSEFASASQRLLSRVRACYAGACVRPTACKAEGASVHVGSVERVRAGCRVARTIVGRRLAYPLVGRECQLSLRLVSDARQRVSGS